MIYITKKNRERTRIALNHKLIETIEENADTLITLENGKKYIVEETAEEIIEKIITFESTIKTKIQIKKETEAQ